jgi:hypothetical protein
MPENVFSLSAGLAERMMRREVEVELPEP